MTIDPRLAAFLARLTPAARDEEVWPSGHRFELRSYFTGELPPLDLVTSVRAIVVREGHVLTFQDDVRTHVVPGGRVEAGEAPLVTLARELREEVGIEPADPLLIGFVLFHHLGPKPAGYRYPYPADTHLIYVVRTSSEAVAGTNEPLVRHPRSMALEAVAGLDVPEWERAFLTHPAVRGSGT